MEYTLTPSSNLNCGRRLALSTEYERGGQSYAFMHSSQLQHPLVFPDQVQNSLEMVFFRSRSDGILEPSVPSEHLDW